VVFISISICNLNLSRQDETNLTTLFRRQGPKISRKIMTTIGFRKGRPRIEGFYF
jgi:hypothetical protein